MSFAIITFRPTGPIKSWTELQSAQIHNFREKPIDHGIEGAPAPFVIIGSNNLVADVKKKLIDHGIDPNNLRGNGVLAYEAVMTASSPAFFAQWAEEERDKRLFEWVAAQTSFALDKYEKRVASMVLHRDEETPHVHMVLVPLELVDDKRRKDRGWRYSLVGSSISGPGRFDQLQDEYAAAMAPFGLERGERNSGRKNEPYREVMVRAADREKAATDREVMALNAADAAEQQRRIWLALSNTVAEQSAALDRKLADADAMFTEAERKRKEVEEEGRRLDARAADVEAKRLANIQRSDSLLHGYEDLKDDETDLAAERSEVKETLKRAAAKEALVDKAVTHAAVFTTAFEAIDRRSLPPSVAVALQAADTLVASQRPAATSRYDATASARSVPLPVNQRDGGAGY